MADVVRVVFEGDVAPLTRSVALAKAEVVNFEAEASGALKFDAGEKSLARMMAEFDRAQNALKTGGADTFAAKYAPALADLEKRAGAVSKGFKDIAQAKVDTGQFGGLTVGATKSELQVKSLTAQILAMRATTQTSDPGLFKIYQQDLAALEAELVAYEIQLKNTIRLQSVAAAEGSAVTRGGLGAQPLRGYGGLFRATGLTNAGVNEAEANVALRGVAALGIATSTLVVAGGLVAAGIAIVGISEKLKTLADDRLASEEKIAGAIYKQVSSLHEAVSDYERFKQGLIDVKNFTDKVAELTRNQDAAAIKTLRDKVDADNQTKIAEINRLQANLAISERILEADKAKKPSIFGQTASQLRQDVGLDERAVEKTKRDLAEVQASLDQGKSRFSQLGTSLDEITKSQNDAFAQRFKSFQDSQEQSRKLEEERAKKHAQSVKEGTAEAAKLTKGYRDEFDKLYAKQADDNPFARQMVANSKAVDELKDKLKGATPELKGLALSLQESANQSKVFELALQNQLQTIDLRAQESRFRDPTQKEQQAALNRRLENFARESNSTNPDVLYRFQQEQKNIDEFNQRRQQDIIDQKLDIAARAKTDEQKAIADKAVTSFAGSLNPDDLTSSERSRIADAFERSAARNEKRQEDSLALLRSLEAAMLDITKNGLRLSNIAQIGGKTALDITLKDDTSDKKATGVKTATPEDVSLGYSFGPSGLSNK